MNINLTLVGQMITFTVLVVATMRYIWPPLEQALEARRQKIAEGIAAAEASQRDRLQARQERVQILEEGRRQASAIVAEAREEEKRILAQAHEKASEKAAAVLAQGQQDAELLREQMQRTLQEEIKRSALLFCQKLLGREVNDADNDRLFEAWLADEQGHE